MGLDGGWRMVEGGRWMVDALWMVDSLHLSGEWYWMLDEHNHAIRISLLLSCTLLGGDSVSLVFPT